MRLGRFSAIGLGFVVVAAACSGDDADPTTTSTAAPTTTSTTAPPTTTVTTTTTTLAPPVTLPRSSIVVTTVGIGPIKIGMTVEEAESAAGFELSGELDPLVSETCYFVTPPEDEAAYVDVSLLVENDLIAHIAIGGSSEVTTRSGAGIGLSEDDLRALFPGQIEEAEGPAGGGRAVQFVPSDPADANYRVVFVLDANVVTQYRAGVLPAVAYIEGCL